MARVLATALILLALASTGTGQGKKGPDAKVRAAVTAQLKIGPADPGVAVAVVWHNAGRTYTGGFGLANLQTKAAITPATRFELASLGKPFTALAVLKLSEQKKLALDDDVRKHIPELPAPAGGSPPVRITDLLRHTSGLPDYIVFPDVPRKDPRFLTNEDFVPEFAKRAKAFPPTFAAGQKHAYNNTNYMLLAVVVARASGKSYGEYLKEAVFAPAGMTHSFVVDSRTPPPKHPEQGHACAVGYTAEKGKGWVASWGTPPDREEDLLTVGDGAVWSSLEDLVAFDAALRGNKILKPETAAAALRPSKTRDGKRNTYGFGWAVELTDAGGVRGFWHNGSWGGFQTSFWLSAESGRTYILLGNRGDFDPDKLSTALDRVLR